jgi:hypothetical protein
MIWMTPFAASAPYSVAADGPFNTSIDSMSFGLMKSSAEVVWLARASDNADTPSPPAAKFPMGSVLYRMPST